MVVYIYCMLHTTYQYHDSSVVYFHDRKSYNIDHYRNHGPNESVFGAIAARINGVAPPFVIKLTLTSYVDNNF